MGPESQLSSVLKHGVDVGSHDISCEKAFAVGDVGVGRAEESLVKVGEVDSRGESGFVRKLGEDDFAVYC